MNLAFEMVFVLNFFYQSAMDSFCKRKLLEIFNTETVKSVVKCLVY